MFKHNLKLAVRQLLKYRLQSAVSIVSLAIGFACFSLAAMWIRYETTYDAFHKDAERMYCLMSLPVGLTTPVWHVSMENCDSIVKYCPEVERVVAFEENSTRICQNGEELQKVASYACDSSFLQLFNLHITAGTDGFLHNNSQLAVNRHTAQKLWGDESPLGKEVVMTAYPEDKTFTVTAVVDGWEEHSCIAFDFLQSNEWQKNERPKSDVIYPYSHLFQYVFLLHHQADVEAVNVRLDTLRFFQTGGHANRRWECNNKFKLVPLTQLRTSYFYRQMEVKIEHIRLFAIAGGLLIVCGLLNYLTMFINRLFIRRREIALRTVFGGSDRCILTMFLVEYGLLLAIALLLGMVVVETVLPYFRLLAELPKEASYVYEQAFLYSLLVVTTSMLLSVPVIVYFKRQSLQSSIQGRVGLFNYNNFRKLSTGLQLCVSLLVIFCTVVLMKQLHALRNDDLGFERKDIAILKCYGITDEEREAAGEYLRQLPEVTEVLRRGNYLFPSDNKRRYRVERSRNPEMLEEVFWLEELEDPDGALARFYGLELLKGHLLTEEDERYAVVINETAAKQLGWDDPVGKKINFPANPYQVVGLIKDFKNNGLTTPPVPFALIKGERDKGPFFIFKYHPGSWKSCREKLESYVQKKGMESNIVHVEEEYEKLLKSERNLQKLLTITTSVCILIALFGVWSMIMLTCEQRRKEIAVRKVHGATVGDILRMFFGEYMALLGAAAVVAFPVGYVCMKPWLEQYVVQTEISWWIYAGILAGMALLVSLCIGWRVWKAANSHPADEICKG